MVTTRKRKNRNAPSARKAKRPRFKRTQKYKVAGTRMSSTFRRKVMRAINQGAETKEVLTQVCANFELLHNTVHNIWTNAFQNTRGINGEGDVTIGSRIGNKIFCKNLRLSIMIESQQYRPLASYWLYLVRLKGAAMDSVINASSQMFEGTSTTIPLDFLDSSKCDILYCKKFVLRMPNAGSIDSMGSGSTGAIPPGAAVSGSNLSGDLRERVTNPQIIKKITIPINKTIVYRDSQDTNNNVPASYRYQWVCIAYDNYTQQTGGTTWPIGHITMTQKMRFTDV